MSVTPFICAVATAAASVAAAAPGAHAAGPSPGGRVVRPTPVVVRGGFDWTDAGIGAVAGVGATVAAFGAGTLGRSARRRVAAPVHQPFE